MEKIDKRKFNGGNSTKSNGADKRKNEYRSALEQAATVEDVISVIKMVHSKAVTKQDIKAAQLFLEYYLGKPNQSIDINSSEGFNIDFRNLFTFNDSNK
jgi:hypothetical protein